MNHSDPDIKSLKKRAQAGNPRAQSDLGDEYFWAGKARNNSRYLQLAYQWYLRAAEQDYTPAQCEVADLLMDGDGVRKNARAGFRWYQRAALLGDPEAYTCIGVSYFYGYGVARNRKLAIKWYRKAAALHDQAAYRNLALSYLYGHGVTQDYKKAAYWLKRFVTQRLAWYRISWHRYRAQYLLADLYEYGRGVTQSDRWAYHWYRKSAKHEPWAQLKLGMFLYKGRGTKQDLAEAANNFQQAAKAGIADAMYMLGICYRDGAGVERDTRVARRWITKAANAGSHRARKLLNKSALR